MTGEMEGIIELGGAAAVEVAASAIANRAEQPSGKCKNCHAPLMGPYCAICGQEQDTHRRSLKGLTQDFVKDVVNLDSRILRTARALLFQPGELACAWREGRTRPYVPPVRLYLFVSLIFFLILSFANIGIMQIAVQVKGEAKFTSYVKSPYVLKINPNSKIDAKTIAEARKFGVDLQPGKLEPGAAPIITGDVRFFAPIGSVQSQLPAQTLELISKARQRVAQKLTNTPFAGSDRVLQGVEHIAKDPAAINGPLTTWVPRMLFLLVPLFAAVLMAFYFRARKHYYYVDHLVFALNYFSAAFVILLITAGLVQVLPGPLVALLTLLGLGAYLLFAMKRFYGQGWLRTTIKFAASMAIYLIFILGPAVVIVVVMSISEA
ncbi:MAG TPA: DUF3667 domain-containing protein [Rhizomicrobium sp.]|nr:DUF3667 domain-containing protein [Rhizomicrobium sp.]